MSSHHVIRDEQEPPIFVLSQNFNLETLNELLGWAPLLYVESSLYKWFKARNIKVDGVLILDSSENLADYEGVSLYFLNELKNDLSVMIEHVIGERNFTAFNVFCKRDQREKLILAAEAQNGLHLPFTIFVGNEKTIVSFHHKLVKWLPMNLEVAVNDSVSVTPNLISKGNHSLIKEEGTYTFSTSKPPIIFTEF